MFEVPVHFYSLSPDRVRRTTVTDGLSALGTMLWRRVAPAPEPPQPPAEPESVRSRP